MCVGCRLRQDFDSSGKVRYQPIPHPRTILHRLDRKKKENNMIRYPLHEVRASGVKCYCHYHPSEGSSQEKLWSSSRGEYHQSCYSVVCANSEWFLQLLSFSSVNDAATDGTTPLYLATQDGNLDCLKYLHSVGGKCDARARDGMLPVHAAAQNGHLDCVGYLVKKRSYRIFFVYKAQHFFIESLLDSSSKSVVT